MGGVFGEVVGEEVEGGGLGFISEDCIDPSLR